MDRILLTGDGRGPFYDEVAFMRRTLLAAGVAESALISDPLGLRTRESMLRASETYELHRVVIVSQRFHNFRALYLARAKGLDAIAVDAADPGGFNWRMQWREWLARPLAVW
ncbi:ElyC/SanA/YdcF family protein, partial [Arthrospira platensis SPKY1]|nr:ElyC/SanA/YdcF family protein [Arthrospira platensis SPKY1]